MGDYRWAGWQYVCFGWGDEYIKVFDQEGTFVRLVGTGPGTADGNLSRPYGVTFDSTGNVWVADRGNQRVQKFSSTGVFLSKFGSAGSAVGRFSEPNAITIDSSNNLYVTDRNNHRVQKFDANGTYLMHYAGIGGGAGAGQLNQPVFSLLDPKTGELYVYELVNMRITVFAPNGSFVRSFSTLVGAETYQRSFSMAWELNGDITISLQNSAAVLATFKKDGTFVRAHYP